MTADARELHARIWQMREVDGIPWKQVSSRLEIPEPTLAKIRSAAVEIGLAVKDSTGRVTWLPPAEDEADRGPNEDPRFQALKDLLDL